MGCEVAIGYIWGVGAKFPKEEREREREQEAVS